MRYFLSCDWGTSSFRLRIIHRENREIISEIKSDDGCAKLNQQFNSAEIKETKRLNFYRQFLQNQIYKLQSEKVTADALPVIISGMASSTIGMYTLPYAALPVSTNQLNLGIKLFEKSAEYKNPLYLISGLCTNDDVMRGEETIILGCTSEVDQTLILPGTHSKHIAVENGLIKDFKTFMTGELFSVLSNHSTLSVSVKTSTDFDQHAFEKGVELAGEETIQSAIFKTRTNQLFNRFTPEKNTDFLSGILIGSELYNLKEKDIPITLVSYGQLADRYKVACEKIGLVISKTVDASTALIIGQCKLADKLL